MRQSCILQIFYFLLDSLVLGKVANESKDPLVFGLLLVLASFVIIYVITYQIKQNLKTIMPPLSKLVWAKMISNEVYISFPHSIQNLNQSRVICDVYLQICPVFQVRTDILLISRFLYTTR